MASNKTQLKAKWEDIKGRVTGAWGALTDDDIARSNGDWDQLVATIREKTGDTLEAVETKLDEILDKLGQAGRRER